MPWNPEHYTMKTNEVINVTKKFIFQYWEDGEGNKTWYYGPKMECMIGIKNYKILSKDEEPDVPGEKEEEGVKRGRQTLDYINSLNNSEDEESGYRVADHFDEIASMKRSL
tara:strand:- start:6 stop:338 length:333 start_codon:yes stop_codon:yes gene_type:complete